MFEDIKRNKFKSGLIVSIFILMITLIVYYICHALELGTMSIIIALVFSIVSAWGSYYYSDKIILKMNGARPATPEENKQLINILDGLMVSSGLEYRPKLYVEDSPQANAFATGRNPKNAVICVTTGLLEKMNYYELEAVVAHELGHIRNYDIRLSAVVTVMVGLVVMLADMVTHMLFWSNRDSQDSRGGNPILMIIGLACLILSPIFATLMQLAISRRREYLADATAVEFTRNPDGMISALTKLGEDTAPMENASTSTAHMYVTNPFKEGRKSKSKNWFSTHPSIEDRIEAIKNIR